jgi:hypothetical protein
MECQEGRSIVRKSDWSVTVLLVALIPILSALQVSANFPVTPVAIAGKVPPGTLGVPFSQIYDIGINDLDVVTLRARMAPGDLAGIWGGLPDGLALLVKSGDQAPGTPDGTVFRDIDLNVSRPITNDGMLVFGASLSGPDVTSQNDRGIWARSGTSVNLVARKGSTASGLRNSVLDDPLYFYFVKGNQIGYYAFVSPSPLGGLGSAVYGGEVSSPKLVLVTGQLAAGGAPGEFYDFGEQLYATTATGKLLIGGYVGKFISQSTYALWAGAPGSLEMVLRDGQQIPMQPEGVVYAASADYRGGFISGGSFGLDDQGQVAFDFFLKGPGVDKSNNYGIWAGHPGNLQLVARSGAHAPGTAPGVKFGRDIEEVPGGPVLFPFNSLTISAHGQLAFTAGLNGDGVKTSNDEGLWAGPPEALRLVVREGDVAPGTASKRFARVSYNGSTYVPFSWFVQNDDGELLFLSGLDNGRFGLWAADTRGGLALVALTGESLDVGGGESRYVQNLIPNGFNNVGQVAFIAQFIDGTDGAFIAVVPEPSSLWLLIFATSLTLRPRGHGGKCKMN